ncbi:MAG: phosphatidate cytidylyltransferase [Oscillospiraceae bacterium]|nr:phosphatidate cytidylyltransferase [Oscillospiraceae bacterium]
MKQRVISALIGLLILSSAIALIGTIFFNMIIAAVSVMALFEMLRASGCLKNPCLDSLSFLMAAIIPFFNEPAIKGWVLPILFLFFVSFCILLIKNLRTERLEQVSVMILFSLFVPLFFSCAVFMRDFYGVVAGSFYLLFALGCAWLCDTCAYFAGRAFGRHKLAPFVSPKKTVEGLIGGLLGCTVFMILIAFLFTLCLEAFGVYIYVNYIAILLLTPVCAMLGVLGDLFASVIKRQFSVKDFGDIMPGHGGVMDRFDSVLFTIPATFIIAHAISLISVL